MTTTDRLTRLEQTRASRLRNHIKLLDCTIDILMTHLTSERLADAQQLWAGILQTYVEDQYQPFQMESWTYLSLYWGPAFRQRHSLREPHSIPMAASL